MRDPEATARLDRHALVMAFWLPTGLVSGTLLHFGVRTSQPAFVVSAFGIIIAGFLGHIVVNATLKTEFTVAETALGLVAILASVIVFGLALLFAQESVAASFVPLSIGLVSLVVAIGFYLLTRFGTRGAFESFDVIRDFGQKDQRLP